MLLYDFRFLDTANKRLIYGAGISPNQLPLIRKEDGSYEELQGEFVPMICTGQMATNGVIFEGDAIECDVAVLAMEGLPTSYIKTRGVMQFVQGKGCFTLNIQSKSREFEGMQFKVINSVVIGCALLNPELLDPNHIQNENKQIAESGASASQDTHAPQDASKSA